MAHSLDLIYDMESFNELLSSRSLSRLEHYETFLRTGKREVTVVHYISAKETHERSVMTGEVKTKVERGFKQSYIIDCKDHLSNYCLMIENALNRELRTSKLSLTTEKKFRVDKYWCVNMSTFTTPQESAELMHFGASSDDLSVVVVNWRGIGKGQVVKNSAKGVHLNNRVAMFNTCNKHLSVGWRNLISYSPLVLEAVQQFTKSLGILPTDAYAAVHIRSEKLGLRDLRLPQVTKTCFTELTRLVDSLARDNPSLKFFYFTDYAPYSSDTCKNCRGAREIRKHLSERNIHNTYFDPLHFNLTTDHGFAAAVESQFMASADFLFLCGGGGYQSQISARLLELNSELGEKNIIKVCSGDEDVTRVLKLRSNDLTSGIRQN